MKVFRKKRFIVCLVAVVMFAVMAVTGRANALTDEELLIHSLNDVYFYERCGTGESSNECGITVSGSTIEEKIWSGLTSFMSEEQAAGVMGNMAHEGGFSPARHETTFLNSSPNFAITTNAKDSYGVGLIQWSFGRRVKLLEFIKEKASELLDKYIDSGRKEYGGLGGSDFLAKAGDADTNTLIALELCYLKQEIESNNSYGGIMNTTTVDEASDYFLEHVEIPANISGQRPIRRADAQKYYNQFHGKTVSGSADSSASGDDSGSDLAACTGGNTNNIVQSALELAWPLGTKASVYKFPSGKPTDAFVAAVKALKLKKFLDHSDCGEFVTTVVRHSGYDPSYVVGRAGERAYKYAAKKTDKWETIRWYGAKSDLKNGDIINAWGPGYNHEYIIVDINGTFYEAEAGYYTKKWGHVADKVKNNTSMCKSKRTCYITRAKGATNGAVNTNAGTVTDSGQNNNNIGASAVELAWPYSDFTGKKNYKKKATDKFKSFYETLSGRDADANGKGGKSCDYFLHTVLVYAGLESNDAFPWGNVGNVRDYLVQSDNWEEVSMSNNRKLDEYKDGDVIIYLNNGSAEHVAILVETDGKKYTAQASYGEYYGVIKGTGNITGNLGPGDANFDSIRVFRNKNNKSSGSQCDVCEDGSVAGELKAGGFTSVEEATAFMQSYIDAASPGGKYYRKTGDVRFGVKNGRIHDAGCPYGVLNNCVAFSQWFVNNYTTVGPDWNNTTNGVSLVGALEKKGLERGKEPRPYAIFSKSGPSSAGHTGVILGVDADRQKVIVGDAACMSGGPFYKPRAYEKSFSDVKNWWFAYTDSVISMGGPLKNA